MDTRFCLHPVWLPDKGWRPCGKCPVCRMKYRKQMAIRILFEQKIDKPAYSYFITLTYDEQHIPKFNGRDCFSKDHVSTFLDSLKHRLYRDGYTYRYFLTCEYGEAGYRPHYHAILFLYKRGAGIPSVPYPRLTPGLQAPHFYFNDTIVQPLWNKGFTYQGTVSGGSVLYCTSYALKDNELLEREWEGFEPGKPFRLFSLRPGLGLSDKCVSRWIDYIVNDRVDIRTSQKINCVRGPVSSGIPVGIKIRMRNNYSDEYDLLLAANSRFLSDTQKDLDLSARRSGPSKVYGMHGPGFKEDYADLDLDFDKKIIAFRKALRKMNKDAKRL